MEVGNDAVRLASVTVVLLGLAFILKDKGIPVFSKIDYSWS